MLPGNHKTRINIALFSYPTIINSWYMNSCIKYDLLNSRMNHARYPHMHEFIFIRIHAWEIILTHWAFKVWYSTVRVGRHVGYKSCVSPDFRCWKSRGSVWPYGEIESIVPAGARQQCMIIGLVLWSAFCFRTDGPWPLTSSHSWITIPLCWSPNSLSISLRWLQLLLTSADKRLTTDCWWDEGWWWMEKV